MQKNRLDIVAVGPQESDSSQNNISNRRNNLREVFQAQFERMWLTDPEQFNPLRNAMERTRVDRTYDLVKKHIDLSEKKLVDLGCGNGVMAEHFATLGAHVDAVDIANNALKIVESKKNPNVTAIQDFVPKTTLKDEAYDLVISTELIGYLNPDLFRLYFSELSRLIHSGGSAVSSTAIDIRSFDALQRYGALVETEFKVDEWIFSYHALYIRILNFLTAPEQFVKASNNEEYRQKKISEKSRFYKWWFDVNSRSILANIWKPIHWLLKPLTNAFQQSRMVLNTFESICRLISSDNGISHAIFIGKRKPLVEEPIPEDKVPIERKHKREVWE